MRIKTHTPVLIALAFFLLAPLALAQTPSTTTVSDVLFMPGGIVGSSITVTLNQTMTSPDGYTMPQGTKYVVSLGAGGSFSVQLVPNIGSAPSGTSYGVDYKTPSANFHETWVVPISATAVKLKDVRFLQPKPPFARLPSDQLDRPLGTLPDDPCVLRNTPQGWKCGADNIGMVTLNLQSPTPADTGIFQWKPKNALTVKRISCSVSGGGSVSVNFEQRTEAAPDASGTPVLSGPIVCPSSTTASTDDATAPAILNPAIGGNKPVALMISTTSGSPFVVRVHVEYILGTT